MDLCASCIWTQFDRLTSRFSLRISYVGETGYNTRTSWQNISTPPCLLKLYNISYAANPDTGSRLALASFLGEYARYSDLATFENTMAPYAVGQSFDVVQFNGGLQDQTSTNVCWLSWNLCIDAHVAMKDSLEANLDSQYLITIGYPLPVTEFSTGGSE